MKKNDILILLIPAFLIVVLWVIFNVYHNFVTSTVPPELSVQIVPISPDFDTKVIEGLKKRKAIVPLYETGSISQAEETEILVSTQSGEVATLGGELLP